MSYVMSMLQSDQKNFINIVKDTLSPYVNENILLSRDFNFYMYLKLDKIETMSNKNDNTYRKEIISILDTTNLINCFRDLFPTLRKYILKTRLLV